MKRRPLLWIMPMVLLAIFGLVAVYPMLRTADWSMRSPWLRGSYVALVLLFYFMWKLRWPLRRWWYRRFYLKSRHWKQLRGDVMRRADFTCEVKNCHTFGYNLDVHHITYAHIGHEPLEELVYICRPHHILVEDGHMVLLKNGQTIQKYRHGR